MSHHDSLSYNPLLRHMSPVPSEGSSVTVNSTLDLLCVLYSSYKTCLRITYVSRTPSSLVLNKLLIFPSITTVARHRSSSNHFSTTLTTRSILGLSDLGTPDTIRETTFFWTVYNSLRVRYRRPHTFLLLLPRRLPLYGIVPIINSDIQL